MKLGPFGVWSRLTDSGSEAAEEEFTLPNFYAKWEPGHSGTQIHGYFDLGPIQRLSLRITLLVMLALSVVGMLLNALDLTRGTHFTDDPKVGLVLSILFVPFCVGFYLFVQMRGSRVDHRLLAFIETTLAAKRDG